MDGEAALSDLLRARGADRIDHPGGTLDAHLERVQRRLARLGARPSVQLLVHRYAACDRAATWRDLATRRSVRSRFSGDDEQLDDAALRDFADLSLVNEVAVAEHAPGFLADHGAYFRGLTDAWTPLLSPPVATYAARVFG